jgi:hypothetical protein
MKKTILFFYFTLFTAVVFGQLSNGLIAHYPFNNQSATDFSGNGNHGILTNTTTDTDRFGNSNYACSLNGGSSYVEMPDSLLIKDSISISLWFKTSIGGVLIGHQTNAVSASSPQWVPALYVNTDSILSGTFWGNSTTNINNGSAIVRDDQWHHVVLTARVGQTQDLYLDNALVGTGSNYSVLTGMLKNQIGVGYTSGWPSSAGTWWYFSGLIDDVRIYNRKLGSSDINDLFNEAAPIGVGVEENTSRETVAIYPNPVTETLRVVATHPQNVKSVELYSIEGQLIQKLTTTEINVESMATGIYLVKVHLFDGNCIHKKIMKR